MPLPLPRRFKITGSRFRPSDALTPVTYLDISQSMSSGSITASLYYGHGDGLTSRYTVVQPRFDGFTGDRLDDAKRGMTLKQAHNSYSQSYMRFIRVSQSMESAQHLINDMNYVSSSGITGSS
tara:strand:+ start:312 stop:680 length:369 start_codon:yes stop_codon:yes gene_type:complete